MCIHKKQTQTQTHTHTQTQTQKHTQRRKRKKRKKFRLLQYLKRKKMHNGPSTSPMTSTFFQKFKKTKNKKQRTKKQKRSVPLHW